MGISGRQGLVAVSQKGVETSVPTAAGAGRAGGRSCVSGAFCHSLPGRLPIGARSGRGQRRRVADAEAFRVAGSPVRLYEELVGTACCPLAVRSSRAGVAPRSHGSSSSRRVKGSWQRGQAIKSCPVHSSTRSIQVLAAVAGFGRQSPPSRRRHCSSLPATLTLASRP
jgi:hypothetical protein